jgi:hypothetical protein
MKKLKVFIAIAGVLMVGACSDNTVAPSASAPDATIQGGGATAALVSWDTLRFSFIIDPHRTVTYPLGAGNWITFPAGSLCDPNSSYGPDQWDQPCAVANGALRVNAKAWLDASGHPRIDFDQHIRFVPSTDSHQWVVITFRDARAADAIGGIIGYCPTATSACVDESLTDPSLATVVDPNTGRLTRRIKHFSGYNVFAGYSDSADPSSLMNRIAPDRIRPIAPGGSGRKQGTVDETKRGGYMLAWG